MKDFNWFLWIKRNPMKAVYIFLGIITFGAFLGYAFPGLAQALIQMNLVDSLGKIVGIMIGVGIALAILLAAFGG